MNWDELNLNRFGFKADPDPVGAGADMMSAEVGSSVGGSKSESGRPETPGAKEIITGTVITKCLFQTSGSDDRIEINSYLTRVLSAAPPSIQNVDSFVIYKGTDDLYVLINKYGVFSENVIGTTGYFKDLGVTNQLAVKTLVLNGYVMPKVYYGKVVLPSGGFQPASWTITHPAVGQFHVVHNFGSTIYSVSVTSNTYLIPAVPVVDNLTANYFDIFLFDIYGAPADPDFSFIVVKQS